MDPYLTLMAVGVLSACLSLLLAVFLLVANGPLKRANRYLSGFLVLTALDVAGWATGLVPAEWRGLMPYRMPFAYLQMPLLYAYAVALCFPERRSHGHVIGGIIAALACALTFTHAELNSVALQAQFYLYIALMVNVLVQYRHAYRQSCSATGSLTAKWLGTVIAVSFSAHVLVFVKSVAWIWGGARVIPMLEIVVGLTAVAVTCALTMAALVRQDLFLGVAFEPAVAKLAPDAVVTDPPNLEEIGRLKAYMEEHSPFLDPSLTIRSLARRLGMGQRELSQLINQQLGVHFFDFVNRYRVDTAAAFLADPLKQDLTVLEIALQSGFNTKSSFNSAFSKRIGMTPTEHRRRATFDFAKSVAARPVP